MAGVTVEAGSALAQAIQSAVQPKLIENGWVAEENDTTLSEYVTMMMVNGKDPGRRHFRARRRLTRRRRG